MKKIILFTVALIIAGTISAQGGTVILVASKDVTNTALSHEEIQRIFLGKKTTWADGKKVTPVTQKGGRVHNDFLVTILKKTDAQYDSFWKQAVFTGTGFPPKSLASDAEVILFVEKTGGAVGYIDSDTPHSSLKKIEVK